MAQYSKGPLSNPPSRDIIDEQLELLRTAVEALATDLNQLTSEVGVTGEIKREERARLQWRTQQVLSLTKAIALDRTALGGREYPSHQDAEQHKRAK